MLLRKIKDLIYQIFKNFCFVDFKINLTIEIVRESTLTIFFDSSDKISFQLEDDVFLLQSNLDYSIENESPSNQCFPLHLACKKNFK